MEHVEDHLTLEENDLLVSDDKIVDKKRNRILSCNFSDIFCYYGNILYVWENHDKKNNCDLYEAKQEVEGLTTTVNQQRFFPSSKPVPRQPSISELEMMEVDPFKCQYESIKTFSVQYRKNENNKV